jgi:cytochrome c556
MRYLLLALLALVIGAVLGGMAVNALNKRSAYPKAVMTLLQSNSMALRRAAESGSCAAETVAPHLGRLYAVGGEIEAAFLAAEVEEPRFRQLSQEFRDAVRERIDANPADCEALSQARSAIGEACKACHQVYRG